jgi:hypothetical protein
MHILTFYQTNKSWDGQALFLHKSNAHSFNFTSVDPLRVREEDNPLQHPGSPKKSREARADGYKTPNLQRAEVQGPTP